MKHPFAEKFTSDALLIDPQRADLISASLDHLSRDPEAQKRLEENMALSAGVDDFWSGGDDDFYRPYSVKDGILQIPVRGVLIHRMSFALGGWATGYKYIERALDRGLNDANVKGIALAVDSPGGMVAGCFELADRIYDARTEKPIRAFAADSAYSAAFALASSASELAVTRSGGTGSVGVVTMHVDYSKALDQAGIKVTYIFAGKHKVDGNAVEPLPEAVKARIQSRIDSIYSVFTGSVARGRGIDEKTVRDTEALCFDSDESVAHGFADRVGAFDEEMAKFAADLAGPNNQGMPSMTIETKKDDQASTGITQAQIDAAASAAKAEGVAAERTRMTTILGSDVAKARPKLAQSMVAKGIDAETALALLADAPEEKAEGPAPKPEGTKAKGGGTPFDKHMNADDQPEVGSDDGDEDEDEDNDQAVSNSLLAAHRAATGRRPARKQ